MKTLFSETRMAWQNKGAKRHDEVWVTTEVHFDSATQVLVIDIGIAALGREGDGPTYDLFPQPPPEVREQRLMMTMTATTGLEPWHMVHEIEGEQHKGTVRALREGIARANQALIAAEVWARAHSSKFKLDRKAPR